MCSVAPDSGTQDVPVLEGRGGHGTPGVLVKPQHSLVVEQVELATDLGPG